MTRSDAALRAAILRWYRAHRRDLPWRRTRDPYAIWVSEIMLQQTRVETVIPFYERFLTRFPSVTALAAARAPDVLAAWSGLGYYARARNLHAAATILTRDHDGRIPRDLEALRALSGVGPYTAAAIASIAFDRHAAAIDGNVIRVFARIAGLRGRRNDASLRAEVTRRAEALAHGPSPGDWTQALMELGAVVCFPRDPVCARCPAARRCAARASGTPDRYPEAAPALAVRSERRVLLVTRRGGRVLLVPDAAERGATWTLPTATVIAATAASVRATAAAAPEAAARALARRLGHAGNVRGPIARFRHRTFSHDLAFEVWESPAAPAPRGAPNETDAPKEIRWAAPRDLDRLPLRAPTLKALNKLRS